MAKKSIVSVVAEVGAFAENKDTARQLREQSVAPAVAAGRPLTLDFTGVDLSTQSFIHALLSDVIRTHGDVALDLIEFKGCNASVRNLIEIVASYSQEIVE